jgi:hypothetical protein
MDTNEQPGQSEQPEQGEQLSAGEPSTGGSQLRDQAARAREAGEHWLGQLQEMIDQAGKTAGPVLRDVAAKAAELAAVAAENAGPVAHKAASVTESVGGKLAVRSKDLATDLRKAAEQARVQAREAAEAEKNADATRAEPPSDDAPGGDGLA